MSMLFAIIYATKARGTHHKLALDGLRQLEGTDAEGWRRLFLSHVDVFLEGAKAPDTQFKDFKNHVLHVGDEFWGGAPQKASAWYDKFVRALAERQFEEAVYCAGVLSHYYVDPIHPFHTGQSEAENNMHRAVEWSISRSYDALRKRGLKDHAGLRVAAGEGRGWIEEMVRQGAARSHRYYEPLLSNYNLERGVIEPEQGLNEHCQRFLAELVVYAATGFAGILARGFEEASVAPPQVSLTLQTFLATLGIPLHLVLRKLTDAAERRAVQEAYDELQATGRVEANLSEDDRMVRDLHRLEVLSRRSIAPLVSPLDRTRAERSGTAPTAAAPTAQPARQAVPANRETFYLALADDIEKAPSIGGKTAARLKQDGIHTVGDLVNADAFDLATQLNTRWINESLIRDWQDQSRLVSEIAGVRGRDAQLLVAAGIRSRRSLAGMSAGEVHALLILFCQTKEGLRLHGCESVPPLDVVAGWIAAAASPLRRAAA